MGYLMGYPSCVKTHMAGKSPNPMAFETKWTNHGTPGGIFQQVIFDYEWPRSSNFQEKNYVSIPGIPLL